MGTICSRSYSLAAVFGAGPVGTDVEDIRDQVHALNELVQKQHEEANRRYIELYERHEKEKEQWTQHKHSMEQRMMTIYNYFEQMRSGGLLLVHSLHLRLHLHLHLHTTTKTQRVFQILTMIIIHNFQDFFLFQNCILTVYILFMFLLTVYVSCYLLYF